jgi:hypothetical protein
MNAQLILAGFLLCATPAARAKDITLEDVTPAKKKLEVAFSSTLRSSYFVGSADELLDGWVLQSDLLFTHADLPGWSLLFWWSTDLEDGSQSGSFGNELDIVLMKDVDLGNDWTLGLSLAYYDEPRNPNLFSWGDEDIIVGGVRLTKKLGELTVFGEAELYIPLSDSEEPWLLSVGASHPLALGVNLAATLTWDTGGFGADPGFVSSVALTKSFEIGGGWSLNLEATEWIPFTGDRRKAELVGGVGIGKKF